MLTRARSTLVPVVVLGLALVAAGCGADDKKADRDESASPSPTSTTTSPAPYLEVAEGVELTEPGTALALGQEAVVAFELRQDVTAALAVTVERIERTSFRESFQGWRIDDVTAARTPHFVRLKVTNVGEGDLGGLLLDDVIWADDGTKLEAPVYYDAKQLPVCAGGPLPKAFASGATAALCQVYFIADGHRLAAVTFHPPADLAAITWTGAFSKVQPPARNPKKKAVKQQ
ncbi:MULTISPECIES: hypothetical protein [Nocardioides]|uniref:DUF4352 domain-containing protein n=1 Tax=Nocardioides vastitatis TaxID=2568655 RepID=A0ABW0ZL46_9ACTN|nr:hypothetical protein [Nocardioides sp.]THJ04514.1 hypothetical protein E7Z54_08480 [Nocardioides sp.]